MKKIAKKVGRNLVMLVIVVVIVSALALVAIFGRAIIDWFKAIGWTYILTIALTTLVNAIIFGIADAIDDGHTKKEDAPKKDSAL